MGTIDFTKDGHVAIIRINRPEKLNSLTLSMYDDLGAAFQRANTDPEIHSVVLCGEGTRAFCAGADLKESIPALASDRFDISAWDPAHIKYAGFNKPIVSAVQGVCMGAGFELMLATDIRIASQDAVFQLPEVQHGFVPAGGTLVRLVRQIGYAHAMEIMLTAERFSALDMRERGIVNRIEPFDRVEATAIDMARRLAGFSPTAVQAIKEAALTLPDLPIVDAFREEAGIGQRTFTSDEAKKSLAAFAVRGKDS